MREGNLLIRASAGTGKTFSIATRYLRLMLLDNVDPEKIVALTFSRAAAQEIYTKILERLWIAAKSDQAAAKESEEIRRGLGIAKSWDKAAFASLLRRLLDTQHLGTIATLDSFILRMVRNFPLEMGFQHAVEVLDPEGEDEAVNDAIREILNNSARRDDFVKAFTDALEGALPRVLQHKIMSMLTNWRGFIEGHPDCREWTVQSMCAALDVPEKSECPDLSGLPFCQSQRKGFVPYEESFAEFCSSYDGSKGVFDVKDGVKDLMLHFVRNPDAETYEYEAYRKHYVFACGKEGAAKIRAAVRHMFNVHIQRQLTKVKAQLDFVGFIEDIYNRMSRRKGKLTFSDFTGVSAAKKGSFALENLEFRFDEKFDHWALDEFQDTSELQWSCLRSLVESAATSGEGRTVMTVGDLKQSIYTWRGGNDAPFKEMMSWGAFTDNEFGCIKDNDTSYRYEKNICDFINRVFGPDNMRKGVLPRENAIAIDQWLSADCWKEHKPASGKDGQPKAADYVKVLGVPDSNGKANIESLFQALTDELHRVWDAHKAAESAESVGILVRRNDDGDAIAEHLRTNGFNVVWEGLSAVSDVPVVNEIIDLLRLSEHPDDTFAWTAVSKLLPICSTLFTPPEDGELNAPYVSRIVATSLSHRGLSRTLQEYYKTLSKNSVGLDQLSLQRLRDMIGVAVTYEQRNASRFSIDGFERFLAASSKRELGASSKVVRILSIHRSKGLTLDRVFIPLPEGNSSGIANPGNRGLLYAKDGKWILPHLSADVAALNPKTHAALKALADEELLSNIRMYYVALTRARKAMYVIEPLGETKPSETFFRDVINSAFADFERKKLDNGCEIVFEQGAEPAFAKAGQTDDEERQPWRHVELAKEVERISPSAAGHQDFSLFRRSASDLFSENAGAAAEHGMEVHGQYETIEWATPDELATLPEAFHVAFVKPSPEAVVWREKSYEIYRDGDRNGTWETGQFDRVVFTGEGSSRTAVIYDFKTNAKKSGESPVAFEQRICHTYGMQMKSYRTALEKLTGIDASRIRSVLLLQATGSAVECKE